MTTTQQPEALNLEEFRAKVTRAAREPLLARIAELEEQLLADTVRLNWLDAQVKNHAVFNGFLWRQECGWEIDRGLVCVIQDKKQKKTARQAIDAAIDAQAKEEGEKK